MLQFLLVVAAGVLSYVDRQALPVLIVAVRGDCHISAEQFGYVVGAFSLAYSIANPLWGYLLDRFGLRPCLGIAVALWSAASALHSTVGTFLQLAVLRLTLGLAEGATFPAGVRAAASTFPAYSRGRGVALAYAGGPIGAIVAPFILAPLAVTFGWRWAFAVTGVLGILWLIPWYLRSSGNETPHSKRATSSTMPTILRDRRAWSCVVAYALGGFPLAFVLNHGPLYLNLRYHVATATIAKLYWIPPLGWGLGFLFWGWAYDALDVRRGKPTRSCRTLLIFTTAWGMLPLAGVPFVSNVAVAVTLMGIALFATPGFVTLTLAWAGKVLPSDQIAFLTGIGAGCWSAAVALLMPPLGRLLDIGRFEYAFLIPTVLMLVACSFWAFSNRRSIEPA